MEKGWYKTRLMKEAQVESHGGAINKVTPARWIQSQIFSSREAGE